MKAFGSEAQACSPISCIVLNIPPQRIYYLRSLLYWVSIRPLLPFQLSFSAIVRWSSPLITVQIDNFPQNFETCVFAVSWKWHQIQMSRNVLAAEAVPSPRQRKVILKIRNLTHQRYKDYNEANPKLKKLHLVRVIDRCERLEKLEIRRIGHDYPPGHTPRITGTAVDEPWWAGI